MNFPDPFSQKMANKQTAIGTFIFSTDCANTEIIAGAGFDFAVVDLEHAPLAVGDILNHVRAAASCDITCWARVGHAEQSEVGRILDTGVQGLILSHFGRDMKQSQDLLDAFQYPPNGSRGTCSGVRGLRYQSDNLPDEIRKANVRAMSIGLIEDAQVVDRINEVVAMKGLHAVMAGGPGDLSASMGLHGQGGHPKVLEAGLKIINAAKKKGLKAGVYLNDVAAVEYWLEFKLDFYAVSIDYKILAQAYRASYKNLVQLTSKKLT